MAMTVTASIAGRPRHARRSSTFQTDYLFSPLSQCHYHHHWAPWKMGIKKSGPTKCQSLGGMAGGHGRTARSQGLVLTPHRALGHPGFLSHPSNCLLRTA